ncbi:hypothetical protein D3C81_2079230 [compost metagenome]
MPAIIIGIIINGRKVMISLVLPTPMPIISVKIPTITISPNGMAIRYKVTLNILDASTDFTSNFCCIL